MNLGASVGMN